MLKSLTKNKFNLFIVLVYISICLSVSAKSFDFLFILKPELNFISIINF